MISMYLNPPTTQLAQLSARAAEAQASSLLNQLGSGSSGAAIGAANQAIAAELDAEAQGEQQASQNIVAGESALEVADTGLASLGDIAAQMRQLAVQSGNATLNSGERVALQGAYQQLTQSFADTVGSTEFNGTPLLTGAVTDPVQAGTGSGAASQVALALPTVDATLLGLAGGSVSTPAAARQALAATDDALGQLATARSALGASQAQLGVAEGQTQMAALQAMAALGRTADTDYAAASGAYALAAQRQRAAYSALGIAGRPVQQVVSVA